MVSVREPVAPPLKTLLHIAHLIFATSLSTSALRRRVQWKTKMGVALLEPLVVIPGSVIPRVAMWVNVLCRIALKSFLVVRVPRGLCVPGENVQHRLAAPLILREVVVPI